ncbi:MAG: phenylalanine--tRNA ligase subunit beta, partial [Planctomycetaceae bacterium]|nr:phenylalanine--tRNA ligase subunit beta [Planctomycetaceae bacterium]
MIVSWNWLKQYVPLGMSLEQLEQRLMMAGLNHEGTTEVAGDLAIDLEITSNRPDCLGHIGVAREVAVLWGTELTLPAAQPVEGKTPVNKLVKVRIDCPDLCLRYTARVIRGVKIGPSPKWMTRRLETVGITPINNVVDISNYVLMECGQPLHTFDFAKLCGAGVSPAQGAEIIVRRPLPGETIEAIDHKTYVLGPQMCLICDARNPVAIAGVMGGAQTEISADTRDVLIESAEFDPVSIRGAARQLNLHSDSSYRFERRVDPEGLDWASRRCCELIQELASGELAAGVVDVIGQPPPPRKPIVLRYSQLKRILSIDVPVERVRSILLALGNVETPSSVPSSLTVVPPSWRRDLTREIDLIEEVGRIHGYDTIPEDVGVPMVPSARRREDRVLERVRRVLTALGFDEAVTLSAVDEKTSALLSPWTDAEPLQSVTPVVRGADRLRRSLVPSLLNARRTNEALANADIELFEIAKVYLPQGEQLPREELLLGVTSGRDYPTLRGVIEAILSELKISEPLGADDAGLPLLDPAASCRLQLGAETLGFVGRLTAAGVQQCDLRGPSSVAEIRLAPLFRAAELVPRHTPQSSYPAVSRDLNLVVTESVRWAEVAATVRQNAGPCFESLDYRDTYRDPQRLGPGRKSLLFTITFRGTEGTLT